MNKNSLQETPLISIIIPVYDVENYIERCVDSVRSQTYQNIEIILVDDGSPDNCGAICDDYAQMDDRIVVIHKKNGGLSDARNAGIEKSTADYITFVDSDDYIDPMMCSLFIKNMKETNADVVILSYYECFDNGMFAADLGKKRVVSGRDLLGTSGYIFAVSKLYKKSHLQRCPFRKGKLYEDAFLFADLYPMLNKISIESTPVYYYVHRDNTITSSSYTEKQWDMIEAEECIFESTIKYNPVNKELAFARVISAYGRIADKILLSNDIKHKDLEVIRSFFRENRFKIIRNKYVTKSRKCMVFVELLSPFLSRLWLKAIKRKAL